MSKLIFCINFIKLTLYYRYVDDLIILHNDSAELNRFYNQASEFIEDHLKLEFHSFKKRIGACSKGIDFVGFIHKPYRRLIRSRTLNKMKSIANLWRQNQKCFNEDELKQFRGRMNSYYGLIKWGSTYKFRKSVGNQISSLFIYTDKDYKKLMLPNHEPVKTLLINRPSLSYTKFNAGLKKGGPKNE